MAIMTSYLRDVAAVSDLALVCVSSNEVDGLVLVLGADGLYGLTDGL